MFLLAHRLVRVRLRPPAWAILKKCGKYRSISALSNSFQGFTQILNKG